MLQLQSQFTLSKSRFETIAMPMIWSLIQHGFLPVFSIVGKIMLYSNVPYFKLLLCLHQMKLTVTGFQCKTVAIISELKPIKIVFLPSFMLSLPSKKPIYVRRFTPSCTAIFSQTMKISFQTLQLIVCFAQQSMLRVK